MGNKSRNWYKTIGWLLGSLFVLSMVIGRLPIEGRALVGAIFLEGGVTYMLFGGIILYLIILALRELKEGQGCSQLIPLFFCLGGLFFYTLLGIVAKPEFETVRTDLIIYGKIEKPEEKLIIQWYPGYFGKELWRAIITKEKEATFRRYTTVNLELIRAQGKGAFLSKYGGHQINDAPYSLEISGQEYILEEQHPMNY